MEAYIVWNNNESGIKYADARNVRGNGEKITHDIAEQRSGRRRLSDMPIQSHIQRCKTRRGRRKRLKVKQLSNAPPVRQSIKGLAVHR